MFVGRTLQLPVVFARKSRQIGVSDSYQTSYKTSTNARVQDLYVSTEYLQPGDRVLVVDDFLAGGTTADALIRVCRMAGAVVVGGGFLIEKVNDAGRDGSIPPCRCWPKMSVCVAVVLICREVAAEGGR